MRDGGWHTPEVARAQRELVERELENDAQGKPNAPLREFRKVLKWFSKNLEHPFSLLDVGCGVGHYGILCDRYAPYIRYNGSDASQAMVNEARVLADQYRTLDLFVVKDWSENDYLPYDVILVSQIAEMTDDPPAVLQFILEHAQRFVILHRLRGGSNVGKVGRVYEPTYCEYKGQNWVWDFTWLKETIAKVGVTRYESYWENGATLIVEKQA